MWLFTPWPARGILEILLPDLSRIDAIPNTVPSEDIWLTDHM